jgi:carbon monoxide dehydrogenase subunit G
MGHIEISKTLPAKADDIWETLSHTGTWADWFTIHAGWIEEPPAETEVGARLIEKVVMLGMANKLEWTVETVEAPKVLTISGKGMAGVTSKFSFLLEPVSEGTNVTVDAEFTGSLIVGALGKAVEKDATTNIGESLDKLGQAASK